MYPFIPKGYPLKMHFLALKENLFVFCASVEAQHRQPKFLKWVYEGIELYRISCGDLLFKIEDVIRLIRYVVVRTHSPQNVKGTFDWNFNALAIFSNCWCFLSTMKFCWGFSTHETDEWFL